MAINPLDDHDPAYQARVRERAYHLWEADGRPEGNDQDFWERARELVDMELSGVTGQMANPASDPHADPLAPDIIENPSIQENLGEFPDRFADQGERVETPKPKRKRAEKAERD
jgi:hypothetical protein